MTSQSLTAPQRVRYCTTMAKWSEQDKAHALALLTDGNTLAEAHHATGIPKPTLIRWAKQAGIEVERASERTLAAIETNRLAWEERRTVVAEKAGRLAELAADEATRLLAEGEYLEAQRLMTVMGVSVDKAQLLTGAATVRTEAVPERTPEQEQELAKVLTLVQGAA